MKNQMRKKSINSNLRNLQTSSAVSSVENMEKCCAVTHVLRCIIANVSKWSIFPKENGAATSV